MAGADALTITLASTTCYLLYSVIATLLIDYAGIREEFSSIDDVSACPLIIHKIILLEADPSSSSRSPVPTCQ